MYPAPNILVKNEDQSFQTRTICSTSSSPRCLDATCIQHRISSLRTKTRASRHGQSAPPVPLHGVWMLHNEDQSFQTWTICSTNSSPRCLDATCIWHRISSLRTKTRASRHGQSAPPVPLHGVWMLHVSSTEYPR
ncbi:hypothetical protein RRG08_058992 [Elysia crispata]|uniref:Uncharacterized protein n=1 Tax=Elysia crispata TaxID=231223 RepID=A0AAE0YTS3_9GAST|nr:hypothetical protein RRG08_058992 [Elysia crispata]